MTRRRARAAAAAAIAGAAVTLAVSLGGGTAFAATRAPAQAVRTHSLAVQPAGVTFHPLTLINSWVSSQSQYDTGDPAAGLSNGVVYLAGSLHQPSPGGSEFAILPKAYRPAHRLVFPIYTLDGSEGTLYIDTQGGMWLYGASIGGYSSLAGVAFPLTPPSQKLKLINGWKSGQPVLDGTGDPSVSLSHGVVYLSGSLRQPSGTSTTFATLPKAYRPSHWLYLPVYSTSGTSAGQQASLGIGPQGQLTLTGSPAAKVFTDLGGAEYPLTLTQTKLTLLNGWHSAQAKWGTGDPAASVSNGVAYLSGSVLLPAGSNGVAATLPATARPSHWLYLPVITGHGVAGSVDISPAGTVQIYLSTASRKLTAFSGIHYPLGS